LKVASLSPLKGTRGDTRTDLFTAGKTEESFSLKHVAARLLPPSGGPLGARVALLEVTGGVGKRAFSLSSLFFLVSGFTPRGQGGDGVGEGGSRPRASDHLSDDSCAGGDDPKTIGSACLASSPTLRGVSLSAKRMFKMLWQKTDIKETILAT
jgi:hypothetical protein